MQEIYRKKAGADVINIVYLFLDDEQAVRHVVHVQHLRARDLGRGLQLVLQILQSTATGRK